MRLLYADGRACCLRTCTRTASSSASWHRCAWASVMRRARRTVAAPSASSSGRARAASPGTFSAAPATGGPASGPRPRIFAKASKGSESAAAAANALRRQWPDRCTCRSAFHEPRPHHMRAPASVVRVAETSHALAGGLHRHLEGVRRFRIRSNRVEQPAAMSVALIRRENNHLHRRWRQA